MFKPNHGPPPLKVLVAAAHKELATRRHWFDKHPWKYSPVYCAQEIQKLEWIVVSLEHLEQVIGPDGVVPRDLPLPPPTITAQTGAHA